MSESLRTKLAEDVEYVLELLTQGYRSDAKFELFTLIEKFGAQIQPDDLLYVEVLRDLKCSNDLLVGLPMNEDREPLQLLWKIQKRLRSV